MAFVAASVWSVGIGFVDNNKKGSAIIVDYPGTLTEAEVVAEAGELAARCQACSDAKVESFSISKVFLTDSTAVPPGSSEVERKLSISLTGPNGVFIRTLEVPSPLFTLELPGTDVIDETNANWAALKNYLINGTGGAGNGPVSMWGIPVQGVSRSVITHRRRKPRV